MGLPPLTDDVPLTMEPTPKWIRAVKDGRTVVDSRQAQIVRMDHPPPRTYAFPPEDVDAAVPADARIGVDGLVAVQWDAMDHWYEESEEVFIHPRDPHKRIDALATSRRIQVSLGGDVLADSTRAVVLYEDWPFLPPRYYLPHDDVDLARLRPSDTSSGCPYKGFASYHDVQAGKKWHKDIVWTYRAPFREVDPIRGRLCFYNEHVDLRIDGEDVPRPKTPFS